MEHFSSHPRKRFTARVFVHLDASLHNHSHPPTIMRVQITFSSDSRKCSRQTFLRTRQWLQMRILQQLANGDGIIKRQFDICGMWWHYHLPGFCKTQSRFSIQTLPGVVTRQRREALRWGMRTQSSLRCHALLPEDNQDPGLAREVTQDWLNCS